MQPKSPVEQPALEQRASRWGVWAIGTALLTLAMGSADAHGPDAPKHQIANLGDLTLESGAVVRNMKLTFVTHGKLAPGKDNAILLLHGFGANHHSFDGMIGPGKAFDTSKHFIIASDALGNTQVGVEHSTSPSTSGMGMAFPQYNFRDMLKAQHRLVTEILGIKRLVAVSGISMGADQSVQFAVNYPDFMDHIIPIVGGSVWGTQGYFFHSQMQSIIENCDGWKGGNYVENPRACAANALAALVPYFFSREWWEENITSPEAYGQWRKGWGDVYFDIQDARDLHFLSKAMVRSGLATTPGFNGDVQAMLRSIKARALFIFATQDQFFLPKHIDLQRTLIPNARAVAVDSSAGHIICCGADPHAYWVMNQTIAGFLRESALAKTASK
jgi:homoserine O-acetyltransferase